ncbi:hypothetical protein FEM48_Zijuj06G0025200 [Ziziphus jujuba var. spinosa]|uniref:Amino acid transporter transmembrane domain-containing protein n=1 Tax=Ziziphus jujuba var. spinosa TaxID=714518 RepID=A0A978V6M7_ZIZJJ|nr:hypothetical protein FEM48_Zijuj06G0025200 [Ziziphus jujuba var. spinosa]
MVSVIEQEFQHGLCESGLAPPKQVEDGKLLDDDGRPSRTGTVWTACAHIITACVGAGVLSLAWAISQLGWIAGIVILLIFSSVSLYTSCLLADCYRSPHPVTGKRNYSYIEAVKTILVFRVVETWANKRWPKSGFINTDREISIGKIKMNMNLFKMSWRIGFVAVASVIAMALPFFSDMLALLGALEYWPLVVYFPVEMHIAQNKIAKGTKRWMALQLLSMTCLLISIACAAGALQGLNKGLHSFQPFKTKD